MRCISPLQTHHMPHHHHHHHTTTTSTTNTTAAPPTRILSRYLRKGAPGHRVRGIGVGWGGGGGWRRSERGGWWEEGKGEREREKEGGRDYLGPSSAVQPPATLPPSPAPAHRGALRAWGGGPVPRSHATSLSL